MIAAFRADASLEIGGGHIARSLYIARELRLRGHKIFFICRDFEFGGAVRVRSEGFEVFTLPFFEGGGKLREKKLAHGEWLGVSAAQEIDDLNAVLREQNVDWLIFDSYAIDCEIESAARKFAKNIAVLDDLHDRVHDCDLLIDATLSRTIEDYRSLVSCECEMVLGAQFLPLSSEYAALRACAMPRSFEPRSILVSMGGVDRDDLTSAALKAISKSRFSGARINVVLGSAAPNLEDRIRFAKSLRLNIKLHIDTREMAMLILRSDLAIGAMGVSAYERASLGLCSIGVMAAENQRDNYNALKDFGAIVAHNSIEESLKILDENIFRNCEIAAFNITDGEGVKKICKRLENGHK
ncbi:UDP-2,4-diacetamido-2,4,6-trideoxy-beta-L-altropyranose hydrolase [Campylobacterota bacterium]|nr:UDP-2,4-diacetamido-2,4,6-trideoxy-beta-L-altropyranose hydrolase [Campylobacterota bacterium]